MDARPARSTSSITVEKSQVWVPYSGRTSGVSGLSSCRPLLASDNNYNSLAVSSLQASPYASITTWRRLNMGLYLTLVAGRRIVCKSRAMPASHPRHDILDGLRRGQPLGIASNHDLRDFGLKCHRGLSIISKLVVRDRVRASTRPRYRSKPALFMVGMMCHE